MSKLYCHTTGYHHVKRSVVMFEKGKYYEYEDNGKNSQYGDNVIQWSFKNENPKVTEWYSLDVINKDAERYGWFPETNPIREGENNVYTRYFLTPEETRKKKLKELLKKDDKLCDMWKNTNRRPERG